MIRNLWMDFFQALPVTFNCQEIVPVPSTNNKGGHTAASNMDKMYPEISKTIQENIEAIENIKVNFLEKLEVLPESKA